MQCTFLDPKMQFLEVSGINTMYTWEKFKNSYISYPEAQSTHSMFCFPGVGDF